MANKRQREQRERRKVDAREWASQQKSSFEATSIKLPDGVELWKPTLGSHTVDFMPYVVGKGNPRADEGMEHFEREYTAHAIAMPDGSNRLFCCLWANFRKACPACQLANKQGKGTTLFGKIRHLWIINDKPGDEDNPLKVFDSNHKNKGLGFGEQLATALNAVERYKDFADLEKGMQLQLTVTEQTWPGGKYNCVSRIDFLPRDYEYSVDMLDKAPCLDEMIIEISAKEMTKLLEGGDSDEETPTPPKEEKPVERNGTTPGKAAAKKKPEPEPDPEEEEELEDKTAEEMGIEVGSTVNHKKYGTCEVKHVSSDGTSLRLLDGEDELHKGINPADCTVIEEDSSDLEEEESPTKKPGGSGKPPAKKPSAKDEEEARLPFTDDDDDLDEDEEDEEPEEKPKRGAKKK